MSTLACQTDLQQEQMIETISALQDQLERSQRMAMIGELSSTTTHEFNNLLTTIINYARMGLRHKDEATRDKALLRINDAATRAAKVAGSVMSMTRTGGRFEPISMKQIAEDTLLLMEREFRKYGVLLESSLSEVPNVIGNACDLQRVLLNLLVNARQATAKGGSVRLSLQLDNGTNEVIFSVRDTGTGIPADVLPNIFKPFFSTKSGPDASGKGGSGVGLASCKTTIDAHGGRIRVESTVGKGTAFIIRLPSSTSTAAMAANN
ncbi:MAG: HAMP domain-containing histidine kinase [Planctomycetales bacterium]|nr:HAMP domain-containing histidine kinase [Planctomycetales bacterium]